MLFDHVRPVQHHWAAALTPAYHKVLPSDVPSNVIGSCYLETGTFSPSDNREGIYKTTAIKGRDLRLPIGEHQQTNPSGRPKKNVLGSLADICDMQ